MNRFLKLSVFALGLAALPAFSQTNPATVPTSITIITPITFSALTTLNFGVVAPSSVPASSNNIHIDALGGGRTNTPVAGGNGQLSAAAPASAVGSASMGSDLYALTLKATSPATAGTGLSLTAVTLSYGGNSELDLLAGVSFTPAGATTPLRFGGTMNVANTATTPGTYAGSFVLTGTYN